jgi:hypothetical protein
MDLAPENITHQFHWISWDCVFVAVSTYFDIHFTNRDSFHVLFGFRYHRKLG